MSLASNENRYRSSVRRPIWRQLLDKADRVKETELLLPKPKPSIENVTGEKRLKLLDLGCGLGYAAALWMDHYGPRVARVFASDLSSDYMITTRMVHDFCGWDWGVPFEEIDLVTADAKDLPFADNSLDAVWTGQMLYRCAIDNVINEIKRVLKPGGVWTGIENATPLSIYSKAEYCQRYDSKGRYGIPVPLIMWRSIAKKHGLVLRFVPGRHLRWQWTRRVLALFRPVHITLTGRKV